MPDDIWSWLASRGWETGQVYQGCWLDCTEPGYRREWTDKHGVAWEICLCLLDAEVLERGMWGGDYTGAPLPVDSKASEWPWYLLEEAATG
jgi:hypothetical protein